jgi:hypothetical protein
MGEIENIEIIYMLRLEISKIIAVFERCSLILESNLEDQIRVAINQINSNENYKFIRKN